MYNRMPNSQVNRLNLRKKTIAGAALIDVDSTSNNHTYAIVSPFRSRYEWTTIERSFLSLHSKVPKSCQYHSGMTYAKRL